MADGTREQQRLRVDVCGADGSKVGEAIKYLKSGDMPPGQGVRIAIACLFYPLAMAREGGQAVEIEAAIKEARLQFEHYMSLSKADCMGSVVKNVRFSEANNTTEIEASSSNPSGNGKSATELFSSGEDDGLLDLETDLEMELI
ncbi:MAG TPA: hypothetical protein V6D19_10205 [Stenomitos sp.]